MRGAVLQVARPRVTPGHPSPAKAGGVEVSFLAKHPANEHPVGSVEAELGAHQEVQTLGDDSGRDPTGTPQRLNALPLRPIGVSATCSSTSPQVDE